jgi:hypothetical protein
MEYYEDTSLNTGLQKPADNINATTNTTVGQWETEVQLTNLMKFTNYSIKFAAMTVKGVGNWSKIMLQTDEDGR